MKQSPEILNFYDFVELCDKSGENIKPVVLHFSEFANFTAKNRTRKKLNFVLFHCLETSEVKFRKGSRKLHFKYQFSDEFTSVDFLVLKYVLAYPEKRDQPGGIPSKKDGILKLLNGIPVGKRKFWHDLVANDSAIDLADNTVQCEQ